MVDNTLYKIAFKGLGLGEHEFKFELHDTFFEDLDYSEIKQGNLIAKVILVKDVKMLTLTFAITGTVIQICDRCLENVDIPIETTETLIVRFSNETLPETDDNIIYIKEDEHTINLKPFIYEYITLALPMRKVHPEQEDGTSLCDETMNKIIKTHIIETETDPRWDALKNLNIN